MVRDKFCVICFFKWGSESGFIVIIWLVRLEVLMLLLC